MSATTGFTSKLAVAGNKKIPAISAFDLTAANTEQSFIFPSGTVFFSVFNAGKTFLRLAYAASGTANGGNYRTVPPHSAVGIDGIGAGNLTIYLRAPAIQRVEVEYWT